MGELPALAVVVPILVAVLLAAVGEHMPRLAVNASAALTLASVTVMCVAMATLTEGPPVPYWVAGWSVREGTAVGICLAVDPAAAWLAAVASALTAVVLVFSSGYFDEERKHYAPLVMLVGASIVGFSLAGDLFTLFVFLELMSTCAYALTAYKIDEPDAIHGGLAFAVTNTLAGLLVVAGVALLYAGTGELNLAAAGRSIHHLGASTVITVGFSLVVAGMLVKASIVPFHFWVGDAYAVAPSPVAALFAGILTEVGLYGIARIRAALFGEGPEGLRLVLVVLGCATALVSSIMAARQRHLKRMIAFITSAHAGILLVGVATGTKHGLGGAATYLVSHAALNGGLILVAGAILNRFGSVDTRALRCLGRGMWLFPAVLLLGAAGLAGAPPFGTFWGKAAIEEAASKAGYHAVPYVVTLAAAITGAAILRATLTIFTRLGARAMDESSEEDRPQADPRPEESSPRLLGGIAAALIACALVVGLVPSVREETDRLAAALSDAPLYREAVLLDARRAVEGHLPPWPKPLELVLSIAGVVIAAALGLSRFLGGALGRVRRATRPLFAPIERLHSGHLGAYVAWILVGTAAVGWSLMLLR